MSSQELFEMHQNKKSTKAKTKPSDMAVKVGLLLLLPYILWLSKYDDDYVKTIHNKAMHLNFDGIMLSFHSLISNANMIVHEAGHGVCYLLPCPQFFTMLNGTLFQLALPLLFIYYYKKRKNKILTGLGFIWFAQNLVYVAWYMSYSQTPNLYPFFIEGNNVTHDFWYMFSQLGILEYDWLISGFVRAAAIVILLSAYFNLIFIAFIQTQQQKR